jgi:hypothetical protein
MSKTTSKTDAISAKPSRALWTAALVPPALWGVQGTIGWYMGGHGCPALQPGWSPRLIRAVLQLLTVVSAAAVAGLLLLARRRRQQTAAGGRASAADEQTHFVATLAAVAGLTLLLGLALAGLPSVMVQTCGQAR